MVEPGRPQMTLWRMRTACWRPKAVKKHSEYVILTAFTLQQWSHERDPTLRYTTLSVLLEPHLSQYYQSFLSIFMESRFIFPLYFQMRQ